MFMKWSTTVVFVALAATGRAQVVSFEGTSYPESAGWERNAFCLPMRYVEMGWYVQHVRPGQCGPPPNGDQERFLRSLAEFDGHDRFFIAWKAQSDGDRSEIPGVAPASLVGGGITGVLYHFTIARDQVRFVRFRLPTIYVAIAPDVAHVYYLALYGNDRFVWYIDGKVAAEGVPEGPFPTSDSVITFRAKSWYLESVSSWDYIRYGRIPEDASGDYDSDEDRDVFDYYFIHECLSQSGPEAAGGPDCRFADFDGDGDADLRDFAEFQDRFTGAE